MLTFLLHAILATLEIAAMEKREYTGANDAGGSEAEAKKRANVAATLLAQRSWIVK
jgi:hypothetical protein